jgi:hypothetical protein
MSNLAIVLGMVSESAAFAFVERNREHATDDPQSFVTRNLETMKDERKDGKARTLTGRFGKAEKPYVNKGRKSYRFEQACERRRRYLESEAKAGELLAGFAEPIKLSVTDRFGNWLGTETHTSIENAVRSAWGKGAKVNLRFMIKGTSVTLATIENGILYDSDDSKDASETVRFEGRYYAVQPVANLMRFRIMAECRKYGIETRNVGEEAIEIWTPQSYAEAAE